MKLTIDKVSDSLMALKSEAKQVFKIGGMDD